ncbi:isoleucine--tRNA ligase [Bacteroidales bacterium]|nr:isoleucine--tRNA ligase [Bacteroidales bacterium]
MKKFAEYKEFDLSEINKEILSYWKENETFKKSTENREDNPTFVFYEGPPSANGMPGIHHVISRTIKDIICRYKTLQGYKVNRKAGWDTHGLPVELSVEKSLNITKEDIGKKITIAEYNDHCRNNVLKYTKEWEGLTDIMGYWVDMNDPYITYDNRYIETLWYLLKELFNKEMLYKGYTIQPYSPAAGTGLSTHELNQPGCYRDVKDTTCIAQFNIKKDKQSQNLFDAAQSDEIFALAWTTTPWTLPSNMALAVGPNIDYVQVNTFNPYTYKPICVVLAKKLFGKYFNEKNKELKLTDYNEGDKNIPYEVVAEYKGKELIGIKYEQLIDWIKPEGKAFEIIAGDFVTTEDGTGIVHIAPTFGADDYRVGKQNGIDGLTVVDENGSDSPLVDKQGRFIPIVNIDLEFYKEYGSDSYKDFAGRYVKNAYDESLADSAPSADVDISVMLKQNNRAFKIEKHVHSYPHCWRTDKPVLYYPLDSWFIKTTAVKEKLIQQNNTINWKPESTGTGRFGKWLENLVDWNLSRSRYWGTPLPIWVSEDKTEIKCIGSVTELKTEIDKAVTAGLMTENYLKDYIEKNYTADNYKSFDLHRPYVDNIVLISDSGNAMYREPDLIDVWFDSGAMPYAQLHYPFSITKEEFEKQYPADFIAEGVDQTRGWFFTLHSIATMLFDSVAFKNIISNGLVLDKKGNKMSKRLGNGVDPFEVIEKHGSDPLRWYMITNAQPWDNLKFDVNGVEEVKRKFFGTLYNTYSFFSLYANIDSFSYSEKEIELDQRPEIDRWVLSLLNTLIKEVTEHYNNYEPTKAGRAIQDFVIENLSNWYVRLNRKRYWGSKYNTDKLSAYQTLYTCLETVAKLSSPISPFYMDKLFLDLNTITQKDSSQSVHISKFPVYDEKLIDKDLEEQMDIAQKASSMILGLRRKVNIKVRQPLSKIIVPILDDQFKHNFETVKPLILTEVNVKEVEYITDTTGVLVKKIKPNFKTLGPRYGKIMKAIAQTVGAFEQSDITEIESTGKKEIVVNDENISLTLNDVEISSEDIPGLLVANEGALTVALDVNITDDLKNEGLAREIINRIQNIRKDSGFDVTDKISITLQYHNDIAPAIEAFGEFIKTQTLAEKLSFTDTDFSNNAIELELEENLKILTIVNKL